MESGSKKTVQNAAKGKEMKKEKEVRDICDKLWGLTYPIRVLKEWKEYREEEVIVKENS